MTRCGKLRNGDLTLKLYDFGHTQDSSQESTMTLDDDCIVLDCEEESFEFIEHPSVLEDLEPGPGASRCQA